MNQVFAVMIVSTIAAFVCHRLAKEQGRNPKHWGIYGFLFGLLAVTLLILLPKPSLEQKKKPSMAKEPRFSPFTPTQSTKFWYYLNEEKTQCGPMSFEGLITARNEGKIQPKTYVWNEELDDWKYFNEAVKEGHTS